MTKTLTSLLVGSHFVPPAKVLLEHLPAGVALRLEADPENPYDAQAIKVYVAGASVPDSQLEELGLKLPGMGFELSEVVADGAEWMLGHVASSEGKPLAKARVLRGDLVGTGEFHEGGLGGAARLEFGGEGLTLVVMEVEE